MLVYLYTYYTPYTILGRLDSQLNKQRKPNAHASCVQV